MESFISESATYSLTSSVAELQRAQASTSATNLTEASRTIKISKCCSQLDEFCKIVEVRPDRNLRICHIPGNVRIDSSASECYKETSKKAQNSISNIDIPLQYSINFAADLLCDSEELLEESTVRNTALFFFHGVGGELKVWSPQILFFNRLGFTIVAMDFIGHGLSSVPPDSNAYHFDEMSEDVLAVFDKYSMQMNVVIGHSYGSSFAAVVARSRSNLVHSLIMISGGGPFPLGPQMGPFCLPVCILNLLRPLVVHGFMRRSFERPDRLSACQMAAVGCPMHVLKNTLRGQKWDAGGVDYYSWIVCPTLLMHGRQDRLIPASDVVLMESTIRGSSLVFVEGAGHMVMLESPSETNAILKKFLTRSLSCFKSAGKIHAQLKGKLLQSESAL